jgi:hypothetical protein
MLSRRCNPAPLPPTSASIQHANSPSISTPSNCHSAPLNALKGGRGTAVASSPQLPRGRSPARSLDNRARETFRAIFRYSSKNSDVLSALLCALRSAARPERWLERLPLFRSHLGSTESPQFRHREEAPQSLADHVRGLRDQDPRQLECEVSFRPLPTPLAES